MDNVVKALAGKGDAVPVQVTEDLSRRCAIAPVNVSGGIILIYSVNSLSSRMPAALLKTADFYGYPIRRVPEAGDGDVGVLRQALQQGRQARYVGEQTCTGCSVA